MAFKNTISWLFLNSIKEKNQSFSIRHSVIYPVWCKHIRNPFTFLINRVIFSMPMFSAVHIQFYHLLQIRKKIRISGTKEGRKYLEVQWFYWDNTKCHKYAVFLTKPGNTDQQKCTSDSILHAKFSALNPW